MAAFIYPYEDDTKLMEECLKEEKARRKYYSYFEAGVGNAHNLFEAARDEKCREAIGTDINIHAVNSADRMILKLPKDVQKKLTVEAKPFNEGFENEKFDIIAFNPPYLPYSEEDKLLTEEERQAFVGGKKGIETASEFLKHIIKNCKPDSSVFIVASSNADYKLLEFEIVNAGFEITDKKEKKLDFEKLFCYHLKPGSAMRFCINNNEGFEFLARGKKSIVFMTKFKSGSKMEEAVIKQAIIQKQTNISKESEVLKRLKGKINVPEVFYNDNNIIVMQYVRGISGRKADGESLDKIHFYLIEACIIMDVMNIKKNEMLRPYSNVIIDEDNKVWLIDFERSRLNSDGNIRQLLEYFRRAGKITLDDTKRIIGQYEKDLKNARNNENTLMNKFAAKWIKIISKSLNN